MQDIMWWITVIEIPILTALFGLILKARQDFEAGQARLRDVLNAFRIDVAKNYAQSAAVRELENRITSHLLRIEAKLDVTAIKAEVLSARARKDKP